MARIREYTQQTTVGGEVGGRRATAEDFGSGGAMQQLGQTAMSVGSYMKEQEERREIDAAQEAMSQARLDQLTHYEARKRQHQPGDMSFAEETKRGMSEYVQEMASQYKSAGAKHYVKQHGTQMTASFFGDALGYQAREAGQYAVSTLTTRKANDAKFLSLNPAAYDQMKGGLTADVEAGVGVFTHLDKALKPKYINETIQEYAWAASVRAVENPMTRAQILGAIQAGKPMDEIVAEAQTRYPNDPKAAAAFLAAAGQKVEIDGKTLDAMPSYIRDLSHDKLKNIVQMARQYKNQEDTIADKSRVSQAQNEIAYMVSTGQRPPSAVDINTLAEKHPDLAGTHQYYLQNIETVNTAVDMPLAQGMAMIEQMNPAKGASAKDMQDPSFDNKLRAYNLLQQQYQQRRRAIETDPVRADQESRYAPAMGGMNRITVNDPSKWVDELKIRFPMVEANSERRGMPVVALSKEEAAGIGQVFQKLPVDSPNGGPTIISTLGGIRKELGPDRFKAFIKSVNKESTAFSYIGEVMSAPESAMQYSTDVRGGIVGYDRDQIAGMVARGNKIMTQKFDSAEDKANFKATLPKSDDANKIFEKFAGTMTGTIPKESLVQTATRVYVAMQSQTNPAGDWDLGPKSPEANRKLFTQALEITAGKPSKVGGTSIFRPFGVSDSDFQYNVQRRVEDLGVPEFTKGRYGLVDLSVGDGRHRYGIVYNGIATNHFIDLDAPTKDTMQSEIQRIKGQVHKKPAAVQQPTAVDELLAK